MTDNRMGGLALIAGSVGSIITMSLHPTGRDLFAPGQFRLMAHLTVVAHVLALASLPISFLGALALSKRLASPNRVGVGALVLYGFGVIASMNAAVVSGLVGPSLVREILDAAPPESDAWRIVFDYNGRLLHTFAGVFVAASSAAILLWSAAIVRGGALARGVGVYGCILGPLTLLGVFSGHLRLNVHGFGLVVLGQAVWFIIVGTLLWRLPEK